jgi:heterodisulfide reductase subunit D
MKGPKLSLKQMIEIDGCTRCGECTRACPVFGVTKDQKVTAMEALRGAREWTLCGSRLRRLLTRTKKMSEERLKDFSKEVYQCTLCGRCEVACPVNIRGKEMRISLRREVTGTGLEPAPPGPILENLKKGKNVVYPSNDDRLLWLQNLPGASQEKYVKARAEVVYFVGCVASFYPMTSSIAQAMVTLLDRAGVDFTLLGADEWCCGWPLTGMGRQEAARELMEHNIEAVHARGAGTLLCGCPSCYHMWSHQYPGLRPSVRPRFDIVHSTEYLLGLIREGRIRLRPLPATITYHDPCDLGRGSGLYEPAREIIRSIPGVRFVELANHGSRAACCGGGGDLEMFFPEVTREIAVAKIREIEETGAEIVLSACQQCKRTIAVNARKLKKKFKVLDLMELLVTLSEPA